MAESVKSVTPEPLDIETRKVVNMMCNVKQREDSCELLVLPFVFYIFIFIKNLFIYTFQMTILLRMDDKMNRQLTCQVSQDDDAGLLSHELVHLGFIHEVCFKLLFFKQIYLLCFYFIIDGP